MEKSFHLSMAALGFQNCSSTPVTVMVEVDKAQFAICTLQPGKLPQQTLDYCFTEGEEITFFTEGPGDVHLTGLLLLVVTASFSILFNKLKRVLLNYRSKAIARELMKTWQVILEKYVLQC